MDVEKIGKYIKSLRLDKGLSQNEMSEQIHITRQAISNWENGKAIPDSDMLKTLSEFFNVTIDDILSGEKVNEKNHLEKTALSLVDEANKNRKEIKRIIKLFITSIISLLTVFLIYYFITNYNSIKVYTVTGKKDKHYIKEGIIVSTSKKNYIRLGKIETNEGELNDIKSITLYYKDKNNKNNTIYKVNELSDIVYKFSFKNEREKKQMLNNLYLKIIKENEKITMKLNTTEDFKNNFFVNTKNNDKTISTHNKKHDELKAEISMIFEDNDDYQEDIFELAPEPEITKIEITKDETQPVIEQVDDTIDYEKIKQMIIENGTEQLGSYVYTKEVEKTIINLTSTSNFINIDVMSDNIIYCWQIDIELMNISYQEFENYSEIKNYQYNISSEDMKENIDIMNNYIRKVLP